MEVRVITWNIRRKLPEKAVQFFENVYMHTVFFFQEVNIGVVPSEYCVISEVDRTRGATAILSNNLQLTNISFAVNSHPSAVVAAQVTLPDRPDFTVISLYGLLDENGYSITTLHRILSDLTPLIDEKKRVLIGGDFNASPQWDERQEGISHRLLFQRLENFGFANCLTKFHTGYKQTWRSSHPTTANFPWQLDYLFASYDLHQRLIKCEVVDKSDFHTFSDHNPLEATFDI